MFITEVYVNLLGNSFYTYILCLRTENDDFVLKSICVLIGVVSNDYA